MTTGALGSACSSPSVLHIPTDFGARAPAHLDSRSTETCCGCGIAASWPHQSVYRPARTPGCPVLRVCCLPPVWSRVPRFFAGSDPQGHAATMLLYHTATLPVLSRDEHDRFTMLLYRCCQGTSMTVLPCCSTTLLPCPVLSRGEHDRFTMLLYHTATMPACCQGASPDPLLAARSSAGLHPCRAHLYIHTFPHV